jgi:hypothetical protein
MAAEGLFTVPIARTYPFDDVQQAYRDVATRHTSGIRAVGIMPREQAEQSSKSEVDDPANVLSVHEVSVSLVDFV